MPLCYRPHSRFTSRVISGKRVKSLLCWSWQPLERQTISKRVSIALCVLWGQLLWSLEKLSRAGVRAWGQQSGRPLFEAGIWVCTWRTWGSRYAWRKDTLDRGDGEYKILLEERKQKPSDPFLAQGVVGRNEMRRKWEVPQSCNRALWGLVPGGFRNPQLPWRFFHWSHAQRLQASGNPGRIALCFCLMGHWKDGARWPSMVHCPAPWPPQVCVSQGGECGGGALWTGVVGRTVRLGAPGLLPTHHFWRPVVGSYALQSPGWGVEQSEHCAAGTTEKAGAPCCPITAPHPLRRQGPCAVPSLPPLYC